jgi:hypothetical protein
MLCCVAIALQYTEGFVIASGGQVLAFQAKYTSVQYLRAWLLLLFK